MDLTATRAEFSTYMTNSLYDGRHLSGFFDFQLTPESRENLREKWEEKCFVVLQF
jgi:hypothetical protein